jgi:hypothetical protein
VVGEDGRELVNVSGFRRSSTVPSGSLAKASSVGAKTVNGPSDFRVSTRPAAPSAAARVPNEPAPTAVSTISIISMEMEAIWHRMTTRGDGATPTMRAEETARPVSMIMERALLQGMSSRVS